MRPKSLCGFCVQDCSPWGDGVVTLDVTFSASVENYQENTSCGETQCVTYENGDLGPGTFTVKLTDGNNKLYELAPGSILGAFYSWYCTGDCRFAKAETDLILDLDGYWNNGWYSTLGVGIGCYSPGYGNECGILRGPGNLTTFMTQPTPEPATLLLLLSAVPAALHRRRRCSEIAQLVH